MSPSNSGSQFGKQKRCHMGYAAAAEEGVGVRYASHLLFEFQIYTIFCSLSPPRIQHSRVTTRARPAWRTLRSTSCWYRPVRRVTCVYLMFASAYLDIGSRWVASYFYDALELWLTLVFFFFFSFLGPRESNQMSCDRSSWRALCDRIGWWGY